MKLQMIFLNFWIYLSGRTWSCLSDSVGIIWQELSQKDVWNYFISVISLYSSSPGHNGHDFADDIFKCIWWMKSFIFQFEFQLRLFLRVQLTINQHCLGNGLSPVWRQAITWTNADSVQRCIYTALGGDELIQSLGNSYHWGFQLCSLHCSVMIYLQ